jgi:acyl carrier protein
MTTEVMSRVLAAIRHVGRGALPTRIEPGHSLVLDLGFDSMKVALLSLSLESEFGRAIVLDEWVGSCSDPNQLTVGSLCEYLGVALSGHERATGS